ncbi:MAG: hypothetical protein JXD23_06895 [Spirochaetales bacterium]|nr:hypothetical protein [Spirochaetales bacterium]
MQAILDACRNGTLQAEPRVVISNSSSSGALKRAEVAGVPAFHVRGRTMRRRNAVVLSPALLDD